MQLSIQYVCVNARFGCGGSRAPVWAAGFWLDMVSPGIGALSGGRTSRSSSPPNGYGSSFTAGMEASRFREMKAARACAVSQYPRVSETAQAEA